MTSAVLREVLPVLSMMKALPANWPLLLTRRP
jgi:hypothetical protein